jgi:hypothetical protein
MNNFVAGALVGLTLFVFPAVTLASIGVGVGTGRIEVKEELKNGGIYTLPSVVVFNTGTQKADYSMDVTLNEKQPQLKPNPKWFSFSPNRFSLEPGKSQVVTPSINLPISTPPGEYFAYLEAHPAGTVQQGNTAVGVAAATKLSFTVKPTNMFFGILFRLWSLFKQFAPYSYIATTSIVILLVWRVIRKWLRFEIKVKKPQKPKPSKKPPKKT